jgi:hypothetical protein
MKYSWIVGIFRHVLAKKNHMNIGWRKMDGNMYIFERLILIISLQ